ncbi:RmlC-like cupins domain-containing protein, partial [Dioscorea alata]
GLQQQRSKEKLQKCFRQCEEQHKSSRPSLEHCKTRCQADYGGGNDHQEERGERDFVFRKERFVHRLRTEHGTVRVLPNFYQLSKLLVGVSNYRVSVIDLKPRAFLKPHHLDAEVVLFVANGRGSVGVVDSESRNTHDVRDGDILRIRAGSIFYLANKDNNERLIIVKLLNPVSQCGRFKEYFAVGFQQAYLQRFSREVKRAAFNLNPKELEELFGGQQQGQEQQQQQGAIIRASEQQIRSIGGSEGGSSRPSTESRGPFNLYKKRPTHSSNRGRLIEADRNDYQPLRDLDIQVTFANLTKRSMLGPFFNTESHKIALVTQGRGTLELVCPHLASQRQPREGEQTREGEEQESEQTRGESEQEQEEEQEQEQEQSEPRYERVRTEVSQGTLFVIPPDHATVLISSDENLEVICFETRAENNQRIYLAGPNNPYRRMEDAVKELTFGISSRRVDERLAQQKEREILRGPEERERQDPMFSITGSFGF